MSKYQKIIALTGVIALAVACGGGGDAESSSSTGVFQDREVEGVSYSAESFSGTTDAGGNFQYKSGETITFSVGGVILGSRAGASVITPVELVSGATSSSNASVQNILVFLQSLDEDGDPENGIEITSASSDFYVDKTLDFTKAEATFSSELDGKLPSTKTRVAHEQARAHFDVTMNQINNGEDLKTYEFTRGGLSTVSYSGQVARQALISAIKSYTSGLSSSDSESEVLARLTELYTDTVHDDEALTGYEQAGIDDISTNKSLQGKTAGNDSSTDHKLWNAGNTFKGWLDEDIAVNGGNILTPEGLIWAFFNKLAAQVDETNRTDTNGITISKAYVTEKRQDLNQLIQKFLWGAVNYSQGVDDYLSNDITGKGLLAGNAISSGKTYTNVEHAWDEGFGYFGAAINFNHYSDLEIAGSGGRAAFDDQHNDYDSSGNIDIVTEQLFGHAIYAGKRDADDTDANLDFTRTIFNAFIAGREILGTAGAAELSSTQLANLVVQRNIVTENWERVLLTSAAYYINETLDDIDDLQDDPVNETILNNYAKHWSELKGFALSLQFNPDSALSDGDFEQLHGLIGDSPELETNRLSTYIANLENARDLLLNAAGTTAKTVFDQVTRLPGTTTTSVSAPTTYTFTRNGASTVSYTGQVARQALIDAIKSYTSSLDGDETTEEVLERLTELYTDTDHGDEAISYPNSAQGNINDISSNKSLQGKTAGNDASTDYRNWTNGSSFKGWSDTSVEVSATTEVSGAGSANILTPEGLVWSFFHKLADQVDDADRQDAYGDNVSLPYVTTKRQDLNQLIQKFLWGAVTYSQGTDDYLSNDISGKGLNAGNTMVSGKNYTNLEHAWDEGFGYFGASRDFNIYSDKEIAGSTSSTDREYRSAFENQAFDSNQDGSIDLGSEKIFGHAVYAGKRDLDDEAISIDLTKETFDAFKLGRAIIASAEGEELSSQQMSELIGQRDLAVSNWEKVILASTAYYVNETLDDITDLQNNEIANKDTVRNNYAKHWGELKGFALSLQFNPQSRLGGEQFNTLHELIGDAPELDPDELENYVEKLEQARDLVLSVAGASIQRILNEEFANSGATIGTEAAGDND